MVMDPTLPRIKVRDLLMQAFLTGWERSDKSTRRTNTCKALFRSLRCFR